MDYWIKRDSWDNKLKGYPVYSESVRSSAERWARNRDGSNNTAQMIELPEVLSGCGIDDYDDRLNNKVFKVFTIINLNGNPEKLYFDMYADSLLDVLINGHVQNGIIQSPLTFIARGRMVLCGGELHKEHLKRQQIKQNKVKLPTIKTADLKFGHAYQKTPGSNNMYIYLGKWDGTYYVVSTGTWNDKPFDNCDPYITEATSLGFKGELPEHNVSIEAMRSCLEYLISKGKEKAQGYLNKVMYIPYYIKGTESEDAWCKREADRELEAVKYFQLWLERLDIVEKVRVINCIK